MQVRSIMSYPGMPKFFPVTLTDAPAVYPEFCYIAEMLAKSVILALLTENKTHTCAPSSKH